MADDLQAHRRHALGDDSSDLAADFDACLGEPAVVHAFTVNGQQFNIYGADQGPQWHAKRPLAGMVLIGGRPCPIVEEAQEARRDPSRVLTARELQIATLVAHGQCTKRIACQLSISGWTVQTHLRRIYAKLGVAGRAEMVFRCASHLLGA